AAHRPDVAFPAAPDAIKGIPLRERVLPTPVVGAAKPLECRQRRKKVLTGDVSATHRHGDARWTEAVAGLGGREGVAAVREAREGVQSTAGGGCRGVGSPAQRNENTVVGGSRDHAREGVGGEERREVLAGDVWAVHRD